MKASVIIPVYNSEAFLRECLGSVLAQTMDDFEVICVDDGSTDSSLEMLREYERADSRIRVLAQENRGGGAARNAALAIARGEYLAFLDADDFYEPEMLARMVAAAQDKDAQVALCRSYSHDNNTGERGVLDHAVRFVEPGTVFSADDVWEYAFRFCLGWPWDKLFLRSFVEEHGLTFQELRSTNDALFVFTALALADRITVVDEYLVNHRMGNASSIENTRERSWNNAFLAAEAIEERLRAEGLFEKAEQSYLNWVANFSLWNFETLTGSAQEEFLAMLKQKVVPRFEGRDRSYFYRSDEYDFMRIFGQDLVSLTASALRMKRETEACEEELRAQRQEAMRAREEGERERAVLLAQIEELRAALERSEGECEAARAWTREIEESTSYRIGRVLTWVPRAVKDRLSS